MDGRVVLNDSGDLTTVLLEELGGPVANSSEALNNEGAVLNAFGKTNFINKGLVASQLADGVIDTKASRLITAVNTSLGNKFTSTTALSVDVLFTFHVHVSVLDPGHDLLVGSHVGSKAVDSSTDKAFLDELHCVLAGNSLELTLGKLTGVDLDTTLCTTEWNIGDGELECHKGSKSLNFLKIDVVGVSCATLARKLMG